MTNVNLSQYLEIVAQTPGGVSYLRHLILGIAMCDKPTTQKAVRAKWEWLEIEEVCKVARGRSITKRDVVDGKYPVIAGGQSPAYFHNQYNRNANTITISGSGAYAGFVAYHKSPIFASDCTTLHIADERNMLNEFLFLFLKSKQSNIYGMQTGGAQPHVYRRDIVKLKVPIPPIFEQKHIIAKVNILMALCHKLESAQIVREESRRRLTSGAFGALKSTQSFAKNGRFMISHFDEITACSENIKALREAILDMSVHGGLTSQNSQGWEQATFGDICLLEFGDRITKGRDAGEKHPVYGGGDATFRTDKYNREDRYVISRFAMSEKCVRFVSGKFWLIDSGGTYSIQKKYSDKVLKEYVGVFLLSAQKRIYDLSRGMAQRNLDVGSFKLLNVPIPPITEQKQIVAKVNVLMKLCDKLELALIDLETNRHRYLRAHISAG